jgi:predicted dithiol-disulfide oxidoreductase (DUF899 family)
MTQIQHRETDRRIIVSRAEWLVARQELLQAEKESTRVRDALSARRRRLPMVEIDKKYIFCGPAGSVSLRDLFEGCRQLIIYHFMFEPDWDEGCVSCSYFADNATGAILHLAARDRSFAVISRAPVVKIEPFKKRMGWTFPWLSSYSSDFNDDFAVTVDTTVADNQYNYRDTATLFAEGKIWFEKGELPGLSVFLQDGDRVFYTYSTYQRGLDVLLNTYNYLDFTPLGRDEENQGSNPMAWIRHHDKYQARPESIEGSVEGELSWT